MFYSNTDLSVARADYMQREKRPVGGTIKRIKHDNEVPVDPCVNIRGWRILFKRLNIDSFLPLLIWEALHHTKVADDFKFSPS
jgi:hypothetical protein